MGRLLSFDNLGGAGDGGHGVAGVDDEGGPGGELGEVGGAVVGGDDDGVLLADGFLAPGLGGGSLPAGVLAGGADEGDVGVVVGDGGAEGGEAVEEFEGGGFAHVVDVGFVGEAEEEDAAAFDGFAVVVEGAHGAVDDVLGHGAVHLSGEFDEAGVHAEFAGFPSEVEGVDGDAVSAEAGAGVEGGEAEGFGGGGADDFPDVDVHGIGDGFEFVDEADIDGAVDVFEELAEFGDLAGTDGDDGVEGGLVESDAGGEASGGVAADDFGDIGGGKMGVAGVFALGGVDDVDGLSWGEAAGDDAGDDFFFGGAGVGGAFEGKGGAGEEVDPSSSWRLRE